MGATSQKVRAAVSGLVVIVAGVLLALAGDAAWAERKDRIRKQQVLQDVLREFQDNDARLLVDIETNRLALAAAEAWAEAILAPHGISADSVAALYVSAKHTARFDPVMGALRSLVDGGELSVIRDDELRGLLAGWSDRAEESKRTASDVNSTLAGLLTVHLTMVPGGAATPGAHAAARLLPVQVRLWMTQMEALRVDLRAVAARIEAELAQQMPL